MEQAVEEINVNTLLEHGFRCEITVIEQGTMYIREEWDEFYPDFKLKIQEFNKCISLEIKRSRGAVSQFHEIHVKNVYRIVCRNLEMKNLSWETAQVVAVYHVGNKIDLLDTKYERAILDHFKPAIQGSSWID